jgi:hypothetical protein
MAINEVLNHKLSFVNEWQSFNYCITRACFWVRCSYMPEREENETHIAKVEVQRLFTELKRSAQKKREITPPLPSVRQEFRPSERPK